MQTVKDRAGDAVHVVALSADAPDDSATLVRREGFSIPLVSDPELAIADRYGLRHRNALPGRDAARPAVFLLDRRGVIRERWLTGDWRVRLRAETVLAALAAQELLPN